MIEVVRWNPSRPIFKVPTPFKRFIPRRPVNNFGDLLGPVIINRVLDRPALDNSETPSERRLFAIGSTLHLARQNDVIWGTGLKAKTVDEIAFTELDVKSVRGPFTRDFLMELGIEVPEICGDPGLLVGHFWTREELA